MKIKPRKKYQQYTIETTNGMILQTLAVKWPHVGNYVSRGSAHFRADFAGTGNWRRQMLYSVTYMYNVLVWV